MPVFLKYGQMKGDATEPAHRSWIELTNAQLGRVGDVHPSDGARVSPDLTEIVVTKRTDNASVHLMKEAISGTAVPAIIDYVRDGGGVSLRLELSETLIASYTVSGSGGNAMESLTLAFTKIEFTHIPGTPAP